MVGWAVAVVGSSVDWLVGGTVAVAVLDGNRVGSVSVGVDVFVAGGSVFVAVTPATRTESGSSVWPSGPAAARYSLKMDWAATANG